MCPREKKLVTENPLVEKAQLKGGAKTMSLK